MSFNNTMTKIQKRGDIYFIIDDLKKTGMGHFYLVFSLSDGYRKPNLCMQCTSTTMKSENLVHLIINQGSRKTPLLTKVNPYGLYEVSDKEFEPQNYRGHIDVDGEAFNLIETLLHQRLNPEPIKKFITDPYNSWVTDWNNRVLQDYNKFRTTSDIKRGVGITENKQNLHETVVDQRSNSELSKKHASEDCNVFKVDNGFIIEVTKFNNEMKDIQSIMEGSNSVIVIRSFFIKYKNIIEEISKFDEDAYNALQMYNEFTVNKLTKIQYCDKYKLSSSNITRYEMKKYKAALKHIKLIPYPIDLLERLYTTNQLSHLDKFTKAVMTVFLKSNYGNKYNGLLSVLTI